MVYILQIASLGWPTGPTRRLMMTTQYGRSYLGPSISQAAGPKGRTAALFISQRTIPRLFITGSSTATLAALSPTFTYISLA